MTSGMKQWWSPGNWLLGLALMWGLMTPATGWTQATKAAPKTGAPKAGTSRPGATKPGTRPGTRKPVTPAEKMKNAAPGGVLPKPTLTLLLKSYSEADTDILHLFKLASAPNQAKTLTETFSLFTEGIDTTRPIFVQSYLAGSDLKHVIAVPIKDKAELKKFLTNLDAVDLKNKPVPGATDLYEIRGLISAGAFLKYDPKTAYALIAEWREEVDAYKALPDIKLLDANDLVVLIENDAKGAADRKSAFDQLRKETIAALKKNPKELPGGFELRKSALSTQLEEIGRYFVEAEQIRFGWTLDTAKNTANLEIRLTALPETELAKSIEQLGEGADAFAGIDREKAIVSLSTNYPLDAMQKGHLAEYAKLSRTAAHEVIDAAAGQSDKEKQLERELSDLAAELIDGVIETNVVNGFLRITQGANNAFGSVGAQRVSHPEKILDFVKKMAERLGDEAKLETDVDTEGDVKIHLLTFATIHKDYPELVAADGKVYFGISPTAAWVAGGEGALERLKASIQSAKSGPSPVAVDFKAAVGPWITIVDRRLEGKGDTELRKLAVESFKDKDSLGVQLTKDGKTAVLTLSMEEDLLRFAGRVAAKFVKESFE